MKSLHLSPGSLWRNSTFVLFWSGRSISVLGTVITQVILPILVYRLTNSAFQTSLLAVFEVLPYLCFGLFAGALADRVNRKILMVTCDLLNAALLGSIPLAAVFHMLTIAQIFLVGFLAPAVYVWFDAANFGALPTLVGRENIVAANSYLSSAENFLLIIGPSLAGVLAAVFGPAVAISCDAVSYVISAISLLLITRAFSTAHANEQGQHAHRWHMFNDIREGLRFLVREPLVRTMTLLGFGNAITGGAVVSLLVVYGVRALGLAKTDARIGLLFTAGALGFLLASLLLPHLVKRMSVGRVTLLSLSLTPFPLIGMVLFPHILVGLVLYGLWSACYMLTIINGISLRQMVTPDHLLSRVNATARMIAWGGTPFGAVLGGLLAERTTIGNTYSVMALGVAISVVAAWFSPLRRVQTPQPVTTGNR